MSYSPLGMRFFRYPAPGKGPKPVAMTQRALLRSMSLDDAKALPRWRQPVGLLVVMALAMPIAFFTWSALLNNFVIEVAQFDGSDIGWLHTVREIPGFFAIGVIFLILFIREHSLARKDNAPRCSCRSPPQFAIDKVRHTPQE